MYPDSVPLSSPPPQRPPPVVPDSYGPSPSFRDLPSPLSDAEEDSRNPLMGLDTSLQEFHLSASDEFNPHPYRFRSQSESESENERRVHIPSRDDSIEYDPSADPMRWNDPHLSHPLPLPPPPPLYESNPGDLVSRGDAFSTTLPTSHSSSSSSHNMSATARHVTFSDDVSSYPVPSGSEEPPTPQRRRGLSLSADVSALQRSLSLSKSSLQESLLRETAGPAIGVSSSSSNSNSQSVEQRGSGSRSSSGPVEPTTSTIDPNQIGLHRRTTLSKTSASMSRRQSFRAPTSSDVSAPIEVGSGGGGGNLESDTATDTGEDSLFSASTLSSIGLDDVGYVAKIDPTAEVLTGMIDKYIPGVFSNWHPRYVELVRHELRYGKDREQFIRKSKSVNLITAEVNEESSHTHRNRPHVLKITCRNGSFVMFLSFKTKEEKSKWYTELRKRSKPDDVTFGHRPLLSKEQLSLLAPPPTLSAMDYDSSSAEQEVLARQRENEYLIENSIPEDYNSLFQSILEHNPSDDNQIIEKGLSLADLIGRFLARSRVVVRKIIDEYSVPSQFKEIKPFTESAPGLVNSYSYYSYADSNLSRDDFFVLDNIVYNLCIADSDASLDFESCVDATEVEMIFAALEVEAVKEYTRAILEKVSVFGSRYRGGYAADVTFSVPLTVTIDYKGFRVLATAKIPLLSEDSQVFGKETAPSRRSPQFELSLTRAAKILNLAEHLVCWEMDHPIKISCSEDTEGHAGEDNREYLLQLSRTFPLDISAGTTHPDDRQFQRLRPEFVRSHPIPLSSDSYRAVGQTADEEVHKLNASKAATRLQNEVIPNFVSKIDTFQIRPYTGRQLEEEMHHAGVNIRYLGKVAELTRLPHVRELAITEIFARTCASVLHRALRGALERKKVEQSRSYTGSWQPLSDDSMSSRDNLEAHVTDFFNLVLGCSHESVMFWKNVLKRECLSRFGFELYDPHPPSKPALFLSLQYHAGVVFRRREKYTFEETETPFHRSDFIRFETRSMYPFPPTLLLSELQDRVAAMIEQKQFDAAVRVLNARVQLLYLLQNGDLKTLESVMALNELAKVHAMRRDWESSFSYASAALGLSQKYNFVMQPETADIYMSLYRVYRVSGNFLTAEKCARLAEEVIRFFFGDAHPYLIDISLEMAKVDMSLGEYQPAKTNLHACARLCDIALGYTHAVTADIYDLIGDVCLFLKDPHAAEQSYRKALNIRSHDRVIAGDISSSVADIAFLEEQPSHCPRLGQLVEPVYVPEYARHPDPTLPPLTVMFGPVAWIDLFEDNALRSDEDLAELHALKLSDTLFGLAKSQALKGDTERALANISACLEIRQERGNIEHSIDALNLSALIHEQAEHYSNAAQEREKILKILKSHRSTDAQRLKQEIIAILRLRMTGLSLDMQYLLVRARNTAEMQRSIPRRVFTDVIKSLFTESPSEMFSDLLDRVAATEDFECILRVAAVAQLVTETEVDISSGSVSMRRDASDISSDVLRARDRGGLSITTGFSNDELQELSEKRSPFSAESISLFSGDNPAGIPSISTQAYDRSPGSTYDRSAYGYGGLDSGYSGYGSLYEESDEAKQAKKTLSVLGSKKAKSKAVPRHEKKDPSRPGFGSSSFSSLYGLGLGLGTSTAAPYGSNMYGSHGYQSSMPSNIGFPSSNPYGASSTALPSSAGYGSSYNSYGASTYSNSAFSPYSSQSMQPSSMGSMQMSGLGNIPGQGLRSGPATPLIGGGSNAYSVYGRNPYSETYDTNSSNLATPSGLVPRLDPL